MKKQSALEAAIATLYAKGADVFGSAENTANGWTPCCSLLAIKNQKSSWIHRHVSV